jgi:hypothetical protein
MGVSANAKDSGRTNRVPSRLRHGDARDGRGHPLRRDSPLRGPAGLGFEVLAELHAGRHPTIGVHEFDVVDWGRWWEEAPSDLSG